MGRGKVELLGRVLKSGTLKHSECVFFYILGASAKDPPLKLTSMLIGISLIKILVFYKIFFLNELRVKFLSSLKKKSVKNSE